EATFDLTDFRATIDASEEGLQNLALARANGDVTAAGREVSVGGDKTDRVGELGRPDQGRSRPKPIGAAHAAAPSRCHPGDARIRRRRQPLRPVLAHARIYAYASRRGKVTTARNLSSFCANPVAQIGDGAERTLRSTPCVSPLPSLPRRGHQRGRASLAPA